MAGLDLEPRPVDHKGTGRENTATHPKGKGNLLWLGLHVPFQSASLLLKQALFFTSHVLRNPVAATEETHPSHSCVKTTGGDNYAAD